MLMLAALLLLQEPQTPPPAASAPRTQDADVRPRPMPLPPAVKPGSPAGWSATTMEAAAKPENKAWLKKGHAVTLTGEVVDLSCYLQLGKKGDAHKACGAKCVAAGEPAGLLTKQGKVYMLMAEQHHPRRDGQVSLAKEMSDQMGQTITVSGMLVKNAGIPTVFIEAPAK
ncbi:MAG TPA: hypothetical protein VL181_03570 [Holophagaceae bacterium]|jgi:hypothetical protein|nr:hypothetical protein [Holophagaceae bacterium]